jgi:maltooligosyltrehalose trehalohydrolase
MPLSAHVICIQNHDQVGNRAKGERLTSLVSRGARKLAAALLLLAPHTPLLFMGQEYDETAPFQFFTDYGDAALQKAVSEGRRKEFKDFTWDEVPDPQDPATFERSRLTWELKNDHAEMLDYYRQLIGLRRQFVMRGERTCRAELRMDGAIVMQIPARNPQLAVVAEFPGSAHGSSDVEAPGSWKKVLSFLENGYGIGVFQRANPGRN